MIENTFSVTSLNRYIKQMFDRDFTLRGLRLKGEISNLKKYPSGHIYFTLKDEESTIRAVLFAEYTRYMPSTIKDGDEVIVTGYVSVYPTRGEYQVYAQAMELAGAGALLMELELLKKKLAAEGLFDQSRKRLIKRLPNKIGVISASGSAAMADIVTNLMRRNPLLEVVTFPAQVQGQGSVESLLDALKKAENSGIDTLIIGRGGGASEDLSSFNNEKLVREASKFPVPIISAVGHEIDFTLIDYVADARASTPTGAAELATIDKREIYQQLDQASEDLDSSINSLLKNYNSLIDIIKNKAFFTNPKSMYSETLIKVDNMKRTLDNSMSYILKLKREEITSKSKQLSALSPDGVLLRGYAIMQDEKGKVVKSVKDVEINQLVKTRFKDGVVVSTVTNKE